MNQLIFGSLSHTPYWYEVGMLKVPGIHNIWNIPRTEYNISYLISTLLKGLAIYTYVI